MTVPETVRRGEKGALIFMLQLALKRAVNFSDVIDGIFGAKTEKAVFDFQKSKKLYRDGIVGEQTWGELIPYIRGYFVHKIVPGDTFFKLSAKYSTTIRSIITANPKIDPLNLTIGSNVIVPLGFDVMSTEIPFFSLLYSYYIDGLTVRYPFILSETVGKSVMGKPITALKIGNGKKHVFYNASHHANEWITTLILLRFLEYYAKAYVSGAVGNEDARELFDAATIHLIPLVNPDGVDLVTGYLNSGSFYNNAVKITKNYPSTPFPSGWKANILGTDLNLQYPAGWENAREIKFSQGYVLPAPRDYVGKSPLSAPEAKAVYDYTEKNDFALTVSYHTQGEVIYWKYLDYVPKCSEEYVELFSLLSGYALDNVPFGSGYAGYKDFFIYEYMRPGFTVEAGKGVSPLPLSQFDEIFSVNLPILVSAPTYVCTSTH